MRPRSPLARVRTALAQHLAPKELSRLPRHYQRVGDVLLLDLPLPEPAERVAEAYATTLGARTVLGIEGPIEGEFRRPRARLLWGDPNAETVHRESGILYRLDASRLMWSAGNLPERQRVAHWRCAGQTVVDFFAGVGYFAIPIARRAGARRVVAIEKNPEARRYLVENGRLNGVDDRLEVVGGDCRDVAPTGTADRVLLGLLPDALEFVPHALAALRPTGGLLHVHRVLRRRDTTMSAFAPIAELAAAEAARARLLHVERVKSYGPSQTHVVLDVAVTR